MYKRTIWLLISVAVLLTACGQKHGGVIQGGHNNHSSEHHSVENSLRVEDVKVAFTFPNEVPKSKQDANLKLQIQHKDGKTIDSFDINHEKKLHLIVVNKDLSYFDHIHPEPKDKGRFEITTQFPAGGQYKLFADFVPTGAAAMTKSEWVTVYGEAAAAVAIQPDSSLIKSVQGKEVTLTADPFVAGKEVMLTFTIKDDATKKPITDLQQYLGAVGHVVILSQDAEQYLHVHPMEEKTTGPAAKFMTTFPERGVYKIWGQFQHGGKGFTVPFVVQVQ